MEITPAEVCITREQAITNLIESVALQESGLSHIINAEGEKIQKAVAMGATSKELLCINKSVQHLISTITILEMVLHSKLTLFQSDECISN